MQHMQNIQRMQRQGTYSQLLESEFAVVVCAPMWVPGLMIFWVFLGSLGLGEVAWFRFLTPSVVFWPLYGLAFMFVPLSVQGFVLVRHRRARDEKYTSDLLLTLGLAVLGPISAGISVITLIMVALASMGDTW